MSDSPKPLIKLRVHELTPPRSHSGGCVGYERGVWRAAALAEHVMEWLPEFALNYTELSGIRASNAVRMLRKAAQTVYTSEKYGRRGEFGELLLHILIRQAFDTVPAVSKIFYKDSTNETVKGFDAVHCVLNNGELQLWLGESKFYSDIRQAVRHVVDELHAHAETSYLRSEFALILNKVDPRWPHAEEIKRLLDPNISLDDVFSSTNFAVLLTYDSDVVRTHKQVDSAYEAAFHAEIAQHAELFRDAATNLPGDLTIHLFLLPLESKKDLVDKLHQHLQGAQSL